jgi:SAM-dependent methyltransferase
MSTTAAYDPFAWFYDRYWNKRFHSRAWPIVECVLLPRLPAGAAVLDAGCGTGYLAALLARRGFRVTGVDGSPEMLACARRRAPEASFQVAGLSDFRLEGRFQAALSTFDTLNHLLAPADLAGAMQSVARALAPGGFFLFDMLLEEAYREHWQEAFSIVEPDHVLVIDGQGFDPRDMLAHCRVTMFRLVEGAWQRADTVISERCYSRDEIGRALEAAGFAAPACFDARDLGMAGDLGVGRVFFLAQLPE